MTRGYYISPEQAAAAAKFYRGYSAMLDFKENARALCEDVRICNRGMWWADGQPSCPDPAGAHQICAYVEATVCESEHRDANTCRCCASCRDRCYDEA